jgi:hypothetical protein
MNELRDASGAEARLADILDRYLAAGTAPPCKPACV